MNDVALFPTKNVMINIYFMPKTHKIVKLVQDTSRNESQDTSRNESQDTSRNESQDTSRNESIGDCLSISL